MRAQVALIAVSASLSLACLTLVPAFAAKNPAMEACSKQWEDMKSAGKTEGQTWPSFWSQCSKDFAAKNGNDAASSDKSAKTTETGTDTTPAAKPAKSRKTASKSPNEDDTPSSAQQKRDCDQKWDADKAKTGAHGWHDYFQFMAKCI